MVGKPWITNLQIVWMDKWAKTRCTQVWHKVCIKLPLNFMHVPNKFSSLVKNKKKLHPPLTVWPHHQHTQNLFLNLSWDHFSSSLQAKTQQFGFWIVKMRITVRFLCT